MGRAVLLAGGIVLCGSATGGAAGMIAQSGSGGSSPFDWNALVGGALGSSPAAIVLAWRLQKADKELTSAREEIRSLHAQTLDVANRMAPILTKATDTLEGMKAGMESMVTRPAASDEMLRALREMRGVVDELRADRGRRGDQ